MHVLLRSIGKSKYELPSGAYQLSLTPIISSVLSFPGMDTPRIDPVHSSAIHGCCDHKSIAC
jgi:hypothetical protein